MHDVKQVSQKLQYDDFEKDWENNWKEKFPSKDELKDKILKLKYDDFHDVKYAFGKLSKALSICNFLYGLTKTKPPQDTEKIIITTLVSCAEAVYRINKPDEGISENLIKGFFRPVKSKIDYKIRGNSQSKCEAGRCKIDKSFSAVEVLYLVRNDYIHNGNFTGKFFIYPDSESLDYKLELFYYSEKENKARLIEAYSECNLTYQNFLSIFLEAFIKNIEEYCKKNKANVD